MLMDRDAIATMIPHAGTMCLLDGLLSWNEAEISCISQRHHKADNPLRRADGTLGIAIGIELAAQAMALHGALNRRAADGPKQGFLASARDVQLFAASLDTAEGALTVNAERIAGDASGATYRFALTRDGAALLSGRATVMLNIVL
jgi:predicted hotdog family 3-hydroxylacyl-ACP dehydratase